MSVIGSIWYSLVRYGALHAACIRRCEATHIHPSTIVGGAGIVHALLQQSGWSGVGKLACTSGGQRGGSVAIRMGGVAGARGRKIGGSGASWMVW